ncbi:L-ascorbate metabolism protein UlaG (beta-lactamase superfamily) [Marmoricola sp. OAE513]|uniref:MBL fold metallo-hydrolase n=1 Tax=Marmoricola sp. OAE513 TaxID=2817894 RepID=UPI001AE7003D
MNDITFIGTATTLLRIGSFTLLTDPNFLHRGQRAYLGKGLWSRRLTEPALQPEQLPELDAVVLSHLHGDHFDRVARRGLTRDAPVLTTPHAARRLDRWGFTTQGLRTWERASLSREREQLCIESVPAVHARGLLGRLLPPVMGSILEHRVDGELRQRLYLSGDTLTGPHLDEIAERYPGISTAVVHLGGTRVLFHTVTLDARGGTELLRTVRPQHAVPVHFDDYRVFKSPLTDFLRAADRDSGLATRITPIRRGQSVELPALDRLPGPPSEP